MPRIDHTAICVRDLEAARGFWQTYFGATPDAGYHNPRTGLRTHFLTFQDGTRLEIMTRPELTDGAGHTAFGWNHLALSLGSEQAVDELTHRLRADGYEILDGPRTTGDGYYETAFLDAEGNRIEITV